jgi:hypothetical protein
MGIHLALSSESLAHRKVPHSTVHKEVHKVAAIDRVATHSSFPLSESLLQFLTRDGFLG